MILALAAVERNIKNAVEKMFETLDYLLLKNKGFLNLSIF